MTNAVSENTGAVPTAAAPASESAADAALTPDGRLSPRSRTALVLLLAAVFVVFLNETVMSVAIPSIQNDLRITPTAGQWLTTAFALTMAVVIPTTGWLLQRLNTRPVFITAMVLFSVGTLIAATSPTFGLLLLGRVVQASGTAIMMPLMMTTVLTIVPMQSRGRIMGRVSIVMSVAPAIGPAASGLLLSIIEWRGLFWVMLPIAGVMLAIGAMRVPNIGEPRRVPLDLMSVVLSAFAFAGLVYGLSSIGEAAQGNALVAPWIPIAIGAVFLTAFILRQLVLQRRDAALLDLRTFTSRTFTVSVLMLAIAMISLFGTVILLPTFVQYSLLQAPSVVGLMLLPGGLVMGLFGPLVGRLYDRVGPRPLLIPASILLSAVFWSLTLVDETTPIWMIVVAHVAMSLGLAFLFTPLFSTGLGSLTPRLYSHGSATVATIQQVAGAAGTAMFVAFLAIGMAAAGAVGEADDATPAQIADGVHLAFLAGAVVSLVVVALAFFVRKPEVPEGADAPQIAAH